MRPRLGSPDAAAGLSSEAAINVIAAVCDSNCLMPGPR
jgi:hypothetical protein